MALTSPIVQEGLQDFARALERRTWMPRGLGPRCPTPLCRRCVPFLWRWTDIEPLIMRTGELMTPGRGAERRILRLANPGVAR